MPSVMMSNIEKTIQTIREAFEKAGSLRDALQNIVGWPPQIVEEVYRLRDRTDKDIMVGLFMDDKMATAGLDRNSRIVPAVFFQPHFPNISYTLQIDEKDRAVLSAENYENVRRSPLFQNFKYIKAFTPMRRFTTSHGATVKFMYNSALKSEKERERDPEKRHSVVSDAVMERVLNRSFMIDREDRLYHDSVLVRFEDGKLNPKATFTALAAFLDLPYTESLTYCSEFGERDYGKSEAMKALEQVYGTRIYGFDTETLYRTYDDFVNDSERKFIEYFLRDAYAYYGYDCQYYDGGLVDEGTVKGWVDGFDTVNRYIRETWKNIFSDAKVSSGDKPVTGEIEKNIQEQLLQNYMDNLLENRTRNVDVLMKGLRFVNKNGQPLYMMPKLELDPALLEAPVYH